MQPLTDQQVESIGSYSQQRDVALSILSNVTQQLETKQEQNKELTASNASIMGEIEVNKQLALDAKVEAAVVVERLKNEIIAVQKELDDIKALKEAAQNSLDETIKSVFLITDAVGITLETVKETKDELILLKNQVNGNVDAIVNGAVVVGQALNDVQTIQEKITGEFSDKVISNERRAHKLDAREEKLNIREEALNLTYSEVVAKMSKDGKKLSDLNKVA